MPAPGDVAAVCWFRRDLRVDDNGALAEALEAARRGGGRVLPVFVFDTDILDRLPDKDDRRVAFIAEAVAGLDASLRRFGGGLRILHGSARAAIPRLVEELGRVPVFASGDHDPFGLERDARVGRELSAMGSSLRILEDHVVLPSDAATTATGSPFRVFTPFHRAWSALVERDPGTVLRARPSRDCDGMLSAPELAAPARTSTDLLLSIGFRAPAPPQPAGGEEAARERLASFALGGLAGYDATRDAPALDDGTSRLSVHLRFGTVSARALVRAARNRPSAGASKWIAEIAWRDFYQAVLRHVPGSVEEAFQPKFERVRWDDPSLDARASDRFEAWKEGRTGYPFVDAAMRELRATGWMHNRCRMVVASFLAKDLHIHWKRGERWFARWLLDIELASNVGGWQWAAGTGADAQPWFRIFNPVEQGRRWDPDGTWIRRWCPEIAHLPSRWLHAPWEAPSSERGSWPGPIVDHAVERLEAIERFREATR